MSAGAVGPGGAPGAAHLVAWHAGRITPGTVGRLRVVVDDPPRGTAAIRKWNASGPSNAMYYGLGWDGSGGTEGTVPVTPFSSAHAETWSTTPCVSVLGHAICSGFADGSGFQNVDRGVTGAAVLAAGVADQGIENWIWAPYTAPPPGSSSGGGTWMTTATLWAHVDTFLLANNVGALSDVGTDILNVDGDLPYLGASSRSLGVGTYVDIDTSFLTGTEASQATQDIFDRNLPALLAVIQSALQSEVDSALGTLQAPPTTRTAAAADALNTVAGALAGANYYQSTFTQTFSIPAGQSVLVGFAPELLVANAGLGVTGAMAISMVQMKIVGTTERVGTPTVLTVTPAHSTGVRYNYGSTSWYLPITLKTASGQPLAGQPVRITFPDSSGATTTWTCQTDHGGLCQESLGPLMPEPGPHIPITITFPGSSQYLSADTAVTISENPGPTALRFDASSVSATANGFPAGSTVMLSARVAPSLPGASWGGGAPLGNVVFLANNQPVAQCALVSNASGAGCTAVWEPTLAPSEASEHVTLQAVWAGNLDWYGASSTPVTTTIYRPGVTLLLSAHPNQLGTVLMCPPGEPGECHAVNEGSTATLTATVDNNGLPTRGGYTVHFAIGTTTLGSCETSGPTCSWRYEVNPVPDSTTSYTISAWVTGPGSYPPGNSATTVVTYETPRWPLTVRASAPPLVLGMTPVGLGAASPTGLWIWVAPRYLGAPQALWLLDTNTRAVVARYALPAPAVAFTTGPDGTAWTVVAGPAREGDRLIGRTPAGTVLTARLPVGFQVQAIAAASADALWVVGTERTVVVGTPFSRPTPVQALLVQLPTALVAASVVLPGSAGTFVEPWTVAADRAGLWIGTNPNGVVYWVTVRGATAFHLAAGENLPSPRVPIAGIGLNATGAGWVWGYTRSGAGAAWPIAGDGRFVPRPVVFGPTVNMTSSGVTVSDLGVGYLAFSAIGGGHGLPGIAGVSPDLHQAMTLLPITSLPGGGVGALTLLPDGTLWAAVPYSRALYALVPSP